MELNVKERQTGKGKQRKGRQEKAKSTKKDFVAYCRYCSSLVFHIPVFGLVLGIGMFHLPGITLYERHKN